MARTATLAARGYPARPLHAARAARLALGMSARELSERLHLDGSLILRIERGERRLPPDLVAPWCRALGYSASSEAVRVLFPQVPRRRRPTLRELEQLQEAAAA